MTAPLLMIPLLAALAPVEAPVSLTTAEGVGLKMTVLDVDAVVVGPLAFTELRLTFENPQDRVIEGRFRLVLPDGAAVSRFAMKIDGQFMEGEVVEKQAARRAYEDFLHRRQDPALLEQASPNEFTARVFPIPAKGKKELIVSYSQELASSSTPFVVPLLGMPEIGSFSVRVRQGDAIVVSEKRQRFVPARDVTVPLSSTRALRSEDVLVARVTPVASNAPAPVGGTLVLVDTSASRALGLAADFALVRELVRGLAGVAKGAPLSVVAFDQTHAPLFEGSFGSLDDAAVASWRTRRALGASDLGAALGYAADVASARKLSRVVLVSDGVVTAGDEGEALLQRVRRLKEVGVKRIDAIASGGIRDDAALARLVRGTLPEDGAVIDARRGAAEAARRLQQKTVSGLIVDVPGAAWVWPKRLDGVQPGDEVLVVAELPAAAAPKVVVGGRALDVGTVGVAPAPLLRRAWARAKIDRLIDAREREADVKARGEIAEQIVQVSTKHRVLSPFTALLVLETEADYARFGIDRKALADILSVDERGLALVRRGDAVVMKPPPAPPAEKRPSKAKRAVSAEGEAEKMNKDAMEEAGPPGAKEGEEELDADDAEPEAKKAIAADSPPPPPPPPPPSSAPAPSRPEPAQESVAREDRAERRQAEEPERPKVEPYTGQFKEVMALLTRGKVDDAVAKARGWREEQPGDLLALLALGEALEAKGDLVEAGRAYGALIDLFASRADIRRLAGARLDRIAGKAGNGAMLAARLAEDAWGRAAEDRPDHPQGPRGHAWALVRLRRFDQALAVVERALLRGNPDGRFAGVPEILKDDLGLIGAAWTKAEPAKEGAVRARVEKAGGRVPTKPSLRFVLWWETDANDVDFHIHDGKRNHAFYSQRELRTGGRLYADVTTGFGPECFTIEGAPKAFPYKLEAHYYSMGPMGFGMGALRVVQHDGKGEIKVEDRPFIIMVDGAFVDLGVVTRPL
ncbi:MAG: hypothetical protein IT383_21960 [Deltaproteobacteria bacterium]|nr:hypothetical protein [Deltaproteobacteria bacterium]